MIQKKMKPNIFYLNDTDLSNNGKSTIVVGDGISYATNAASIIRNCGILGATEYYFYHAKKLIEKGMKTKDLAVSKAKDLLGVKFREVYSL